MQEIGNARVVLFSNDNDGKKWIALIDRVKQGRKFYATPGGHVDQGELPEVAAVREAWEELGVRVRITGDPIYTHEHEEKIFAYYPAELEKSKHELLENGLPVLKMNGPEIVHADENNSWVPRWIKLEELNGVNLLPEELKEIIIARWEMETELEASV